jgi:hypothetical protein
MHVRYLDYVCVDWTAQCNYNLIATTKTIGYVFPFWVGKERRFWAFRLPANR